MRSNITLFAIKMCYADQILYALMERDSADIPK